MPIDPTTGFDTNATAKRAQNDPNRPQGRSDTPYGNSPGQEDPRGQSTFGGHAATTDANGNYIQSSAQDAANAYGGKAQDAWSAPITDINYGQANGQLANQATDRNTAIGDRTTTGVDRSLGLSSRAGQTDATGLLRGAANGTAPSQAQALQQNTLDKGLANNLAVASSGSGDALSRAAATRNAIAGNTAAAQSGANDLGALRANEMATARGQYAGQTNANRASDISQQGIDLGQQQNDTAQQGVDLQGASTTAQMAQANQAARQAQQQLAAQRESEYNQLAYNTQNDEANRGVAISGQDTTRQTAQTNTNQQSKEDAQGFGEDIANGVGSLIGHFLAKGGHARGAQPYIVGEQGPELVIPKHDGEVIPAHTTQSVLDHLKHRAMGGPIDAAGPQDLAYGAPVSLGPAQGNGSSMNVGDQLKATSDAATRYSKNASSGPFQARAQGGFVAGLDSSKFEANTPSVPEPNDPTLEAAKSEIATRKYDPASTPTWGNQQPAPQGPVSGGVPPWLQAAQGDQGLPHNVPAAYQTLLGGKGDSDPNAYAVTDSGDPLSASQYKARLPDSTYALQYGKSNAPSMGTLAANGLRADQGSEQPDQVKKQQASSDKRKSDREEKHSGLGEAGAGIGKGLSAIAREEGGPVKGYQYGHASNDTGNHLQRRGKAGDVVTLHPENGGAPKGVSADVVEESDDSPVDWLNRYGRMIFGRAKGGPMQGLSYGCGKKTSHG